MKIRTLLFILLFAAIAAFAVLNWNAIMTQTTLSLGIAEVQAPLGLVMLALLAFLSVLFLGFVVYLQMSVLLEARRTGRELQANRELADKAEASRFTELRTFLETEMKRQADLEAESRADVLARIDQLSNELNAAVEQSGTTLSAYIGEMEDRLERGGRQLAPRPSDA